METVEQLSKELKLSFIKTHYEAAIQEAKHKGLDFQEFLNELLYCERNNRRDNGIKQRIRAARFPQNKTLEDFTTVKFNSELKRKFKELETLNFIENKKVLFISVPNLIIELKEAMSKNQITQYKKKFEKFDLVILDELGYVSFDKEGSEILFNLISNRIAVGSMIITTNLMFDRWEEIFKDPILTTALVDRLTYKSHLLNMSGESYRVEETIAWLKSKE
ncbi:hypothetical protein AOC36_06480 [Erysipelothrix larvae]|uniref:IstB-like ATP-binding domain-containing protein n=1 Tax=Erysipelothrix larvae TaxID=1514105 RepID=A0A0X8H0I9_9FIRM|nr:ATP-binding protein [Erysipelothrix larvae]AMC93644.1 hypothetical protein AOC36_06480 [Erysipelothrix larvae]